MNIGSDRWRIVGVNFDHMHMGDLVRFAAEHPRATIVGLCDLDLPRITPIANRFDIPQQRLYTNVEECLTHCKPDIVLLCPKTGEHADYVERVAPFGSHILVEKPMASSLADADRMISATKATGKTLVINWPLAWYPPHITTHRLITQGAIGDVLQVHYYDGNRGPLYHIADKVPVDPAEVSKQKAASWWYQKQAGGGSLLDYLGYGVTLGTWFHGGVAPQEITCVLDGDPTLQVDEHSITIARYPNGLSRYETRWGTFTDPWTHQPQPKCGFVVVGTEGTIASYDYESHISVQSREHPEITEIPVDTQPYERSNPIAYLIHCLETGEPICGPLSVEMSRTGQRVVDSALLSAAEKRTVSLL